MALEDTIGDLAKAMNRNAAALEAQTATLEKLQRAGGKEPEAKAAAAAAEPSGRGRRSSKDAPAEAKSSDDPRSFCPAPARDLTIGAFKDFITEWKEAGGKSDKASADERDARGAFIIRITKHFDVERVSHVEPEMREPVMVLLKKYASDPKVDIAAELDVKGGDGKKDDYV